MDWILIYNKSPRVYYIKDSRPGEKLEAVKVTDEMKATIINQLLEQVVKTSNDFRTGIARQFSQQMQQS